MFDSTRQGYTAFLQFEAPAAVVPMFSCAVFLDAFRFTLDPMAGELLEYSETLLMVRIVSSSAACNLFVLLNRSADNPAQLI